VLEFAVEIAMVKTMRVKIAINHIGTGFNFCSFSRFTNAMTIIINSPEYSTNNFGIVKASKVNGAIATQEKATVRNNGWKSEEPLLGDLTLFCFSFFPELIWQEYITTPNQYGLALIVSDRKEAAKKALMLSLI